MGAVTEPSWHGYLWCIEHGCTSTVHFLFTLLKLNWTKLDWTALARFFIVVWTGCMPLIVNAWISYIMNRIFDKQLVKFATYWLQDALYHDSATVYDCCSKTHMELEYIYIQICTESITLFQNTYYLNDIETGWPAHQRVGFFHTPLGICPI